MILERWTELKEKLISTLNHLKANHKDNWALVKSKSSPKQIKVLSAHQLEKLKGELAEKQSLLQRTSQRKRNELLDRSYDQLAERVKTIQSILNQQEQLTEMFSRYYLSQVEEEKKQIHQDLTNANERIDQLNDKLESLRSLIRTGELKKLQEMVREGEI